MSNHLPFPKNFQTYLQAAMMAFEQGDIRKTIKTMQKALEIEMDEELFHFCVTLMQEAEQDLEALDMIRTYKPFLFESTEMEEMDLLLITLLIRNDHLSQAKRQIDQRSLRMQNIPENKAMFTILEREMDLIEAKKEAQEQKEINDIIRECESMADDNYYSQIKVVRRMHLLPKKELLRLSKPLLINQYIHPLLKTELMHLLIESEISERLEVSKEQYQAIFQPALLKSIHETPFYLSGLEKNETEAGKGLTENWILHCAYYFPFEKEALLSFGEWSDAMNGKPHPEHLTRTIKQAESGLDLLTEL